MLANYEKDEFGVIKQIEVTKISYDKKYINVRYDSYGELNSYMSHLRFGYIVGSIGYVPKSILDVGYGNGSFLKICGKLIDNCYGNDINGYAIPDNAVFVEDITKNHYDVITFFDSLEHFENLNFIENLKCNYLVISVPWCHYFSNEWFKTWKHRRENEHLYHFNKASLTNFISSYRYSLVTSSNIEDTIRKGVDKNENILTCIFKKDNTL